MQSIVVSPETAAPPLSFLKLACAISTKALKQLYTSPCANEIENFYFYIAERSELGLCKVVHIALSGGKTDGVVLSQNYSYDPGARKWLACLRTQA